MAALTAILAVMPKCLPTKGPGGSGSDATKASIAGLGGHLLGHVVERRSEEARRVHDGPAIVPAKVGDLTAGIATGIVASECDHQIRDQSPWEMQIDMQVRAVASW